MASSSYMASQDKNRPLPKFGEWDVNNPASADGFTVIFNTVRDEKKTNTSMNTRKTDPVYNKKNKNDQYLPKYPPQKTKWFCCGSF